MPSDSSGPGQENSGVTATQAVPARVVAHQDAASALHEVQEYAEAIVQTMPDALLVLTTDLRVKFANDAFYTTFQVRPEQTVDSLVYELGNGQWNIPELRLLLEDILPQNKVFTGYQIDHEFAQIGRRVILLNGRRLDHMQLLLLIIVDITEAKRAEAALRASEEDLRLIMDSIKDHAILALDEEGRIVDWNAGAEQVFGYTAAEAVGQPSAVLFTPEDREQGVPAQEMQQARTTGRAADERWHVRKDGTRFFASGVLTPLQAGARRGYVKVARDLTERRQLEERLEAQVRERTAQVRELVTQLTMSEQEERRRVSAILHDDLQQRLFSLMFQLALLRQALNGAELEPQRQLVAEIEAALRTSVQITRELSVDLSPPILHDEGLAAALQWLATQMGQQQGLAVAVQAESSLPLLSEDVRVLLFQTVRELLFNIVKHAGVNTASVTISWAGEQLRIAVGDQGQGFAPTQNDLGPTSQGLRRINQRMQLLGGGMEIVAAPGRGTRVTLNVPLREQREKLV